MRKNRKRKLLLTAVMTLLMCGLTLLSTGKEAKAYVYDDYFSNKTDYSEYSKQLMIYGGPQNGPLKLVMTRYIPNTRVGYGYETSGNIVQFLQRALNAINGNQALAADGSFGPATNAAVKAYQKSKGLTADGIAGKDTLTSIIHNKGLYFINIIP